jgi:alanine dehydrogenase
MHLLTDEDVQKMVPLDEVISSVEEAFKLYSLGQTVTPLRVRVEAREYGGDILLMPCYLGPMGVFATKIVTVYPGNISKGLPTIQAAVVSVNPEDGSIGFIASAKALTGMRTGAASAISVKYLARSDARVLGLLGCGYQAGWQLRAISRVQKLSRVLVYDVDRLRMERFAEEMGRETGIPIKTVGNAEEAASDSDIIVTATTSRTPVLLNGWVKPGTHIVAIGAYTPEMAELEPQLVARSKIVVDSREAALNEAGDLIQPIKMGLLSPTSIHAELGEIVAGIKEGRTSEDEITLFKSVGLAIQDAAAVKVLAHHLSTR